MNFLLIIAFCGVNVLGQRRIPRPTNDEEIDSFKVTLHPKSQKIVEGSPVVFSCISSAPTRTEFTWRLGFKPLIPDNDSGHETEEGIHVHQTTDNMSVLRIDKADMKKHRKKVLCEASIPSVGLTAKAQTAIKIFKQGRTRKDFPALSTYPEPRAAFRPTDRLTLECTSNINPKSKEAPDWRWIKNSTWDISLYKELKSRLEISDSGTLVIYDVRPSDEGTYECVAENRRGSVFSPPFDVKIGFPDEPSTESCTDRKGETVEHGSIYQPYPDPCMECECVSGEERYCTTVMCDEPPCRNYELIEGTCCGFTCPNEEETIDIWTEEGAGTCMQYLGSSCREFIQGSNIYLPPQQTQQSIENKVRMLFTGAGSLSENCMEYILPFLCFHTVPLCDDEATQPRGRPVCKEDCRIVADMCQDEFIVFRDQMYNGTAILPQCEELPARQFTRNYENCISFEDFLDADMSVEPRGEASSDGRPCIDRYGKSVDHGELYLPNPDPCLACICHDGKHARCTVVACEPPSCRNYIRSNETCCGYVCQDTDGTDRIADDACRAFNGSTVEEGEWFQPNPDPCYQCNCKNGESRSCRSLECLKRPKDCPNLVPVPGLCCVFTCEERVLDPDFVRENNEPCIANNGSYILNGEYQPGSDPCTTCFCVGGKKQGCRIVDCIPPDCPNPVRIPGTCCEFSCKIPLMPSEEKNRFPSERCIANNGSYILNGPYHPGSDLCTTCDCINGRKEACFSVGCDPPDCPYRVQVPGVCCEFQCLEENRAHRLDDLHPEAPGSLSVQQVGSRSMIVQWSIDDRILMQYDSKPTLLYNNTRTGIISNVSLPSDVTYIVLGDLHHNVQYKIFLMMGLPKERVLIDIADFSLDGRAGLSLFLGEVSHGNVYESRGRERRFWPIDNKDSVHIMFTSFHRIGLTKTKNVPCRVATGCDVLQFYMYSDDGELSPILGLMFDDEKDFNWAKAHI